MTTNESRIVTTSSSSLNAFSPISTLERQYLPPLGQRILIAVQANAACCLEGGVESILRLKGSGGNLSSETAQAAQNFDDNRTEDFDAFSFLNDNPEAADPSADVSMEPKKNGIGKFFRKVAASTSATLERQMQGLAVRMDKGRNADLLRVGMYDPHSEELLGVTEPLPLPQGDRQDMRFQVPLMVEGRRRQQQFILKLWIQSGAAILQSTKAARCYLLGSVTIDGMSLKPGGAIIASLASNLLVGGQLHLCTLPDQKFAGVARRSWSLADPDMSAYSSDMCYLPLDQSYVFTGKRPEHWLIATERATESAIVLPLAAACMDLWAKGAEKSLHHAHAIADVLRTNRHDGKNDSKATCSLSVSGLDSTILPGGMASLSISWRRPDSIFELEVLANQKVSISNDGFNGATPSVDLTFYPKVCTDGILPGVLQSFGGQMPASGFLLGAVYFSVSVQVGEQIHVWESVVGMEGFVNNPGNPVTIPLVQNGQQMGNLHIKMQVTMPVQRSTPKHYPATDGLLSLVGMDDLAEGVSPMIDNSAPESRENSLRQQQLDTMGYFYTSQYMDQHIALRMSAVDAFKERARSYKQALVQPERGEACETKTPRAFRPSSSRTVALLSGLPFNCHTVQMNINVVDTLRSGEHIQEFPGASFQNITHGAPSDHARGFGNVLAGISNTNAAGGLRRLESKRLEIAESLKQAQSALISGVGHYLATARRSGQVNHVPARATELQGLRWKVFEAVHSLHHLTWMCAVRRANVFSQSLGLAVTSYLASISDPSRISSGWPEVWKKHGYLVSFEGLLSAAGKELGMIEDASIAIQMLRMVRVVLMPDNGIPSKAVFVPSSPFLKWVNLFPSGQGKDRHYLLQLGVDATYYKERVPPPLRDSAAVQFYPVLYQVGVDIRQWGAHAGSNLMKQNGNKEISVGGLVDDEDDDVGIVDADVLVALNHEALRKMNAYAHAINPKDVMLSDVQAAMKHCFSPVPPGATEPQLLPVHPTLVSLHEHILSSAGRMNHAILDEAATLAQQLGGGGLVFCKSGKDRTAMHVTYKQAQFAARYRGENDPELVLKDATILRIHGTRLPICEKNVGQAKYAFNSLQVQFMPEALKPPMNTLAGFLKGGRLFGEGAIES